MKFKNILFISLMLFSNHIISQIDTILIYNLDIGKVYLLGDNGVKKIVYCKNDTLSILLNNESLLENGKIDPGSSIDIIYGVKSEGNLIGVLRLSKLIVDYTLYDISDGKRIIKNILPYFPKPGYSIKYKLIDCFTVSEINLGASNQNRIIHFTKEGKMQEYLSSEQGLVSNKYIDLWKSKKQ